MPKLYSCYSHQINQKGNLHVLVILCFSWVFTVQFIDGSIWGNAADYMKQWTIEAWGACSHKKVFAASAATAFWNLSSVKTRIFTGKMHFSTTVDNK